jgi:hypothetical protein
VAVIAQFGQLPLVALLFTPSSPLAYGNPPWRGRRVRGGGLEASREEAGEEGPHPTYVGCIPNVAEVLLSTCGIVIADMTMLRVPTSGIYKTASPATVHMYMYYRDCDPLH